MRLGMPFKFNRIWLEDADFNSLIRDFWTQYRDADNPPMQAIYEKLLALKS